VIALGAVHTTGVNWDSVGVLLAGVVAAAAFLDRLQARRHKSVRDEIASSVNHLGQVLNERLETKDTVHMLAVRVAFLEGKGLGRE
jgi:hypothetical protein